MGIKEILVNILTRVKSHAAAVQVFFKKAGIPFDPNNITLADLRNLMEVNPQIFSECMDYIYPDANEVFGFAGANSSFDWKGLVGGILTGTGSAFMQMSDSAAANNAANTALLNAEYEKELAEQKATSTRNTLLIVLGILVVGVIAAIFIFKKRF